MSKDSNNNADMPGAVIAFLSLFLMLVGMAVVTMIYHGIWPFEKIHNELYGVSDISDPYERFPAKDQY
ncbi:hypothetical protein BBBOND_0211160 [Babesia bigemina]|uniref:Uncharacterized protein n=1 Tax=Babesia bigemina TaxID=5866 RepID=A0A061DAN6_BABBI|nr:hypothetical protein BBBOND_0211160 [Babesia bigemina]CDR95969.1 hypothetical protein BBBOND_0211160 [Babesia bigemina]|eukprot:XP_012768155.1 hypothetical protein BBBOND_0211160 [Babesia bigemina]